MTVGILGLQGCIEPHERMLERLGVHSLRVRLPSDLANIERIILPGGESTTMLSLLERAELFEPLQFFGRSKPMWGICAGAILMAQKVEHPAQRSLGLMSLRATRNYYGSQLDSFKARIPLESAALEEGSALAGDPLEADFIRAPLLNPLAVEDRAKDSPTLSILANYGSHPVLFQQGHLLACSFHTELGEDARLHEFFLSMKTGVNTPVRSASRKPLKAA